MATVEEGVVAQGLTAPSADDEGDGAQGAKDLFVKAGGGKANPCVDLHVLCMCRSSLAGSGEGGNVMQAAVNRAIVKLRSGQLGAEGGSPTVKAMSGPMREVPRVSMSTLNARMFADGSMVKVHGQPQVAMQGVLERARQLNACVAYGGVSATALMEDDHVRVLLSLLPTVVRTNGAAKQLTIGA